MVANILFSAFGPYHYWNKGHFAKEKCGSIHRMRRNGFSTNVRMIGGIAGIAPVILRYRSFSVRATDPKLRSKAGPISQQTYMLFHESIRGILGSQYSDTDTCAHGPAQRSPVLSYLNLFHIRCIAPVLDHPCFHYVKTLQEWTKAMSIMPTIRRTI